MNCFVGIDIGTSSAKALAVNSNGNIISIHREEYDLLSPHGGWSEENPETWWAACKTVLKNVVQDMQICSGRIEAIAISNQMHSLVILDQNMISIRPSILHNDARTSAQVCKITSILSSNAERLMHNPIVNGMTLPSLLWVKENEPDNFSKIRWVFTPGDYIRFKLTGNLSTDHSNASATLIYDFESNRYSKYICHQFDLNPDWFPACFNSNEIAGYISSECAQETGLDKGTPVIFGGADQVMQSIGCGAIYPHQATSNIGSGGQICIQTKHMIDNPAVGINAFIGFHQNRYYMMGANTNAGSAYKWFFRNILQEQDYNTANQLIADIHPGSDGLIFIPYLNGERCPHQNAELSGVFWGMNYHTERRHMMRAVMEGICYSMLDCLNTCIHTGAEIEQIIALGGAVNSPVWLQIQSDIYNLPLHTTTCKEQAVLGAAITAAVGCGAFSDFETACIHMVRFNDASIQPSPERHEIYMRYYDIYRRIYQNARQELEEITRLGRKESNL